MSRLQAVVEELEAHAADLGWDRPARLFALVPTAELVAARPELAETLAGDGLTPVEQDPLVDELEDVLGAITWPESVAGCACVVERLVLPPGADDEMPVDDDDAATYVAEHPDRREVRIVAGVDRDGATFCALRLRDHDDARSVIAGPALVPALLELLSRTLTEPQETDS